MTCFPIDRVNDASAVVAARWPKAVPGLPTSDALVHGGCERGYGLLGKLGGDTAVKECSCIQFF